MTLADLLTPSRVIADMQSEDQEPALAELVECLVAEGALPEALKEPALEALRVREDQRSTGIGGGVAIPHCFLSELEALVAVFGRSNGGVDFCAVDRAPVHYFVLFIVPEAEHNLHLKTLSAIAKMLDSADTRRRLAEAGDASEIVEVLSRRAATV